MPADKTNRIDKIFARLVLCVLESRNDQMFNLYNNDLFKNDMFENYAFPDVKYFSDKYDHAMLRYKNIFVRNHEVIPLTVCLHQAYAEAVNQIDMLSPVDTAKAARLMSKWMVEKEAVTAMFLGKVEELTGLPLVVDIGDVVAVRNVCNALLNRIFEVALLRQIGALEHGVRESAGLNPVGAQVDGAVGAQVDDAVGAQVDDAVGGAHGGQHANLDLHDLRDYDLEDDDFEEDEE